MRLQQNILRRVHIFLVALNKGYKIIRLIKKYDYFINSKTYFLHTLTSLKSVFFR